MAQTVGEIAELLNDMRVSSEHNAENFEKILAGINSKLELMNDDNEKSDLIRIYFSELKKTIDDNHSSSLVEIENLKNSFNIVNSALNKLDIEDNIKIELQNISRTLAAQIESIPDKLSFVNLERKIDDFKPILNSLEQILTESIDKNSQFVKDKFDNLQSDFQNIVTESDFKGFKSNLADFIQRIIDNSAALNSELKFNGEKIENILLSVKSLDFKNEFENVVSKIDEVKETFDNGSKINYGNLSSEITSLSKNFTESFNQLDTTRQAIYAELKTELTDILANLKNVTEACLKFNNSDVLNSISNTSEELNSLINFTKENSDSNYEAVKIYLEELTSNISALSSEFKELSGNNFSQIVSEISGIQQAYSLNSKNNFESLKSLIENLSSKLSEDFENQKEILLKSNDNFDKLDNLNIISEDIRNINSVLDENKEFYKNAIKENVTDIKNYLEEINASSSKMLFESDNKLFSKLEILDTLNNTFESSVSSLNSNVSNVVDNLTVNLQENSIIKSEIENLKNNLEQISETINSTKNVNNQLSLLVSSLMENVAKESGLTRLEEKFESIDYSVIIEKLSNKLDNISMLYEHTANTNKSELTDKIENIKYDIKEELKNNDKSEMLLSKLDNFSYILSAVKGLVEISADTNSKNIEKQIEHYENYLSNVVTIDDFKEFKSNFGEFVQKIIDNTNISNVNSDIVKDHINNILQQLENLNYTGDFENIANSINDIRLSFENNSKMNYENLYNEIMDLKSEINSNKEVFSENVNLKLEELLINIRQISEETSKRHLSLSDSISSELNNILVEWRERTNSGMEVNFGEIKVSLESLIAEINRIKADIETERETSSVSSDNTKTLLNTIQSELLELSESFNNTSSDNVKSILARIENLSLNLDELKNENISKTLIDKVLEAISELSLKLDGISENNSIDEKISILKNSISELSSDIQISSEEYKNSLKESFNLQTAELNDISDNISGIKDYINEIISSLKNYITELNINSQNTEETSAKLLEIKNSLIENAQNYDDKIDILQSRLEEFAHIVENSNSDTEGKISTSIEEISTVREEFVSLREFIKSSQISDNENFSQILSIIDAGIENITFSISTLSDGIKNGIESTVKENLDNIDSKFADFNEILSEVKNEFDSSELLGEIDNKISMLTSQYKTAIEEINDTINANTVEITKAFEPLKEGVEGFLGFDFETLITELKQQLDLSFMNFNVDVNSELTNQSTSINKLEESYRDIYSKIANIEECITENVQNNIELLNTTLESNVKTIKQSLNFEEQFDELKSCIDVACNDSRILESFENLKAELIEKFEKISAEQESLSFRQENITSGITSVTDNLKGYISAITKAVVDKYNPEKNSSLMNTIQNNLVELNSKVDVIALDNSTEEIQNSFDELYANVDSAANELKEKIDTINETISTNTNSEELKNKINEISDVQNKVSSSINELDSKINDTLNALHAKVDTLAENDSSVNIIEEIDDIKNAISDQRKYFEESTDERYSAIDKYLRDVLLKLDNVDIEKNAEDIKESILNALISVTDQISFVEETEDLKDFVEEKTDTLKESLAEVQNQLKQLASSDADFEYTYTLQDVESDIARLRLAINNISDTTKLNEEIKRLSFAVENLEPSLTDEQVSGLKEDFEKINEEMVSLSTRTNKLILNSDESYKALNDGLNDFSNLISKLDERFDTLDNSEINERLEQKLDNLKEFAENSASTDKVIHKVMMYLGEWIDSTTGDISEIEGKLSEALENTNKIPEIIDQLVQLQLELNNLKASIPEKSAITEEIINKIPEQSEIVNDIVNNVNSVLSDRDNIVNDISSILPDTDKIIEKLVKVIPDNTDVINELKTHLIKQDERIDSLENKLERILSQIEEKDDMVLNRKIDKLEKMISILGANVEKLTSYVDE